MPKANHQTDRSEVAELENITNLGPSLSNDLRSIGIATPQKLIHRDPWKLYHKLVKQTGVFHDPCVLDVFMAAVDYMNGNPPQVWWAYTKQRKLEYTQKIDKLRTQYTR